MNSKELIERVERTFSSCLKLMKDKNADYSTKVDAFSNFKKIEELGITSVEKVIMTRVADKLIRITNLLERDNVVNDESVLDSIDDGINYLALLKTYLSTKEE